MSRTALATVHLEALRHNLARVRAAYDVEKARCRAHAADERLDCLRDAREDRVRAVAAARNGAPT